jgi:hypothetical protein
VKELTVGALPDSASSVASREGIRPPPCIIDWSDQVARAEEDLANAVVVSVINDGPLAAVEEVAEVIAARIEVVVSSWCFVGLLPQVTFWFSLIWPWLSVWLGCSNRSDRLASASVSCASDGAV